MRCPSETQLQAFVDGALSPGEIDVVSAHLDGCEECRVLVSAVLPLPLEGGSACETIGRYVLRRVVGRGSMGVVYEAVDPDLRRVVAVKVLRSSEESEQTRLIEEARNLAALAHSNVVAIHDVGREGDRVFIVMELIRGVSLRAWLALEPRSTAAILDAFEKAAAGLHAAHEAGLVHRDFKPENVLVAHDERVVVGDFGLAVRRDTTERSIAGSLAYMAPEQRRGERVDARSDQFSWCVSLREALGGEAALPRWLRRLLLRGTSARPDERFATMAALLGALRAGRRPRRWGWIALAAAGVALMAAAGAGAWREQRAAQRLERCRGGEAAMTSLWNDAARARHQQAFRRTGSPLADRTWRTTDATLSEYAAAWTTAERRVCEDAEEVGARDATSLAALARRTSCLSDRLALVRSVTQSFERMDAVVVERVPAMLRLLPRVAACENADELAQLPPPPSSEQLVATETAFKQLLDAQVTIAAGRYPDGLGRAERAFSEANAIGYLPLLAEAYLVLGTAHGRLGHTVECERALEQAVSSASAGRAPKTAIRAWIELLHFVGFEGKRYEDGSRWAEYARTALESAPNSYELEAARLAWLRAMLLDQRRMDDALTISRRELALVTRHFGDSHWLAAAALDGHAGVLAGRCRARDALEPQQRACAALTKEYGDPHPQLALCLENLATLHATLGEQERSVALKQRVIGMLDRMPGHPNHLGMARRNLVRSWLELGRLTEAGEELKRAAESSQRAADEVAVLTLQGDWHRREGRLEAARTAQRSAVEQAQSLDGARRSEALLALSDTYLDGRDWAAALSAATEAVTLAQSASGDGSCRLANPLRAQAEALLGAGSREKALPLANRALSLLKDAQLDPLLRARTEFALARALPDDERPRARALAINARSVLERGSHERKLLPLLDAWLAATTPRERPTPTPP